MVLPALATVCGLISLGLAAPTASTPGRFSVKQVRNPAFTQKIPFPRVIAHTYLKYGVPLPEDFVSAWGTGVEKRATGTVKTTSLLTDDGVGDIEYLCPVDIGTPPVTFNLDFDTGSSDMWVFSSAQPASQHNGQTEYNPTKSSTSARLTGATWRVSYGDGSSSSGTVYTDVVTIGGLSVPKQAVEAASTVSYSFVNDSQSDGLLGLGFKNINTISPTRQNPWFDNIKPSLDAPLFSVDLKHHGSGSYDFGFIDSTKYTGSVTYTPVDSSRGYWGFTSSGYQVGTGAFTTRSTAGIADTGTSLLYLPSAIGSAYYAKVTGAKYVSSTYILPCSATPPDFTIGVGTGRITVPGKYLIYSHVECNNSPSQCNALCGGPCSAMCIGSIQPSDDVGINIFGDIILKAAYVVFDAGNNRLGWAQKV